MYTATERFSDASALLSVIESRTVREGRRAFAWQEVQRAKRTRRERIIEYITTTIAAVAWVACVMLTSGMFFVVGTE
jgi:ABC-type Fe3+ transport system permease subunit